MMHDISPMNSYPRIKHVKLELDGVLAVGRSHRGSDYVAIGAPGDFRVLLTDNQVTSLIDTLINLQGRIRARVNEADLDIPTREPVNPTNTLEAYSLLGKIARKLGV